ncbi:hypothetical protein C8Q75DRAFT_761925 [Abortiporus biennis]|nr:hypothetical protein C8Q75DRAFT_761925 [Abortiporus biennis]
MQKTFLGRLMNMQPNKPKINPGEMRRIVHNEYRKSMRAFEHGPNPSPERAQHWRQMAIQFGMNVDSGGNLRDEAVTIKCCSWKYCICFAGKANHPLQICTRCKKVAYCNAKCQKKDWAEHKKSCKKPA